MGGCLSTGPIMAVINRTHAPYSSQNGNFWGEEEKKTKGVTKFAPPTKAWQCPQAIYIPTGHCNTCYGTRLLFKIAAYRRQLVIILLRDHCGFINERGFFWISTLSKVPFGELSMRVGAHWNWHDEQFCLDAKKQKDPTVSEQAIVTKEKKIKSMPQ